MNSPYSSFKRDGVRIAYDRTGAGPLVVFLHGIGGNRTNWNDQLNSLSDSYCCVSWDARGYGDSDDPDRVLEFTDFADDLNALLDHLDVERAHLVGLSMGGYIAQSFYERYPSRVATLTLAATNAGAHLLGDAGRADFLAKRLQPLEAGLAIADMAPALVNVLAGNLADTTIRDRLQQSLLALRPESYKQTLRAFVTTDFREGLSFIRVPTLVITGNQDKVFPLSDSEYLAENISQSQLVILDGAGHLCNIEAPVAFDKALREFLQSAVSN